jgi:uncharacterized membrane protein YoaK (UPF0700 family)
MASFLTEAREITYPSRESVHGPLGPLLVCMTFVSGVVDSFGFLVLGHVFVANQTGNLVLLGLALAGAPDLSAPAHAVGLASFAVGAFIGGRIGARRLDHRGRFLFAEAIGEAAFLIVGVVLAALTENPPQTAYRYSLIFFLASAMGIQTAAARKLAVPDLNTTTFTQVIAGIFADSALGVGKGSQIGRRVVPLGAMVAGACAGTALVMAHRIVFPPLIASLVAGAIAVTAGLLRRSNDRWASFTR